MAVKKKPAAKKPMADKKKTGFVGKPKSTRRDGLGGYDSAR